MKSKLFILYALLIMHTTVWGQIKITKADMPAGGDNVYYSNTNARLDDTTTGPNTDWDFSTITPTQNDTFKFVSPPSLYALVFFGNIAQKATILGQKGYNFFASSSNAYSQSGSGFKIPYLNVDAPLKYSDADEWYKFPLTYGDTLTDTFYLRQDIAAGSISFHGKRFSVVDGWGKITTPYGTFSCIRVKSKVIERDTISYTITIGSFKQKIPIPYSNDRTEYKWLAKGGKIPILQITTALFGQQQIFYKDSARITYNPNGPKPNFTASDSVIYEGDSVKFQNKTSFGLNSYIWDITPTTHTYVANSTTASTNPQVRFDVKGKYTVSLQASSFTGRNSIKKVDYILVKPLVAPNADFMADKTYTGNLNTVKFTDLSANAPRTWQWKFTPNTITYMNGTGDTSRNPQVRFDSVGKYSVTLYAGNKAGTSNSSKSDYITVIKGLGVAENSLLQNSIYWYPNPSQDGKFILSLPDNFKHENAVISIENMQGKKVFEDKNLELHNGSELYLSLPAGVYFLLMKTSKNFYTTRLLISGN